MRKQLLSIAAVLVGIVAQAQQMDLPVTFDVAGINYGLIGFGGAEASSIEADPTNGANTVAKVIKGATAELWAGTTITDAAGSGLASPIPFTESNTQMTLRVWSPDAGIPVRLKVENSGDAGITVETEATTTAAGQWETLTFNFSNQATGTAALNLANSYNKASVFFNFGTTGSIAGEKTYYFDDLQMGQGGGVSSYTVLFSVDMSNVTDAFTTPEVNGTFNTWCGGCAPMSDADGDNVWELAIELAPGTYEYKFAYDSWAGQETLLPGGSCVITANQFTNRILTVSGNETLPVVCWASCSSCDNPTGPFNITFKVDMNEVTDNFTTPEVNGTFNAWCGGCAPMSDADGDNVWELTISLATDTFEYKFAYDSWAGQESLTAGSFCTSTIDNFTNRSIIVTGDATLDPVCWGSCDPCVVGFVAKDAATNLILAPNPANDVIRITLEQSASTSVQAIILNAQGQQIERLAFIGQTTSFNTSNLPEGLYFLHVIGKLSGTKSFVVSH